MLPAVRTVRSPAGVPKSSSLLAYSAWYISRGYLVNGSDPSWKKLWHVLLGSRVGCYSRIAAYRRPA